MPVVRCPGCDRQLNVPETAQRVKCPQCETVFAANSDGITAGATGASLAAVSATAPARRSRAERDEKPAERGSDALLLIGLSVVAALILFAVVGGAGMWFFESMEPEMMFDHAPAVVDAPEVFEDLQVERPDEPVK